MNTLKLFFLTALCLGIYSKINAHFQVQPDTTPPTEQPVITGDFADPSVIKGADLYYATGTSSEWEPHFPIYTSTDLLNWKQIGYAFNKNPDWTSGSFWAPELFYNNNTYYLYYTARRKSDGISCIGVATSTNPAKGFKDHGILLETGKEAIDAFVYKDGKQLYITWKAYGLDKRPIEILGSTISANGLKVTGKPFMLLRDDAGKGIEGQALVKRNGFYYLFYSAGACCGRACDYNVSVARAKSVKGPYVKFNDNPILFETDDWKCTGHGTLVKFKDGKDYYLYHAYNKSSNVYTGRQGMLGVLNWNPQTGWPSLKPLGNLSKPENDFEDEFLEPTLNKRWQWDFRHGATTFILQKSNLKLSGVPTDKNKTGTVLTLRPATGNFTIETSIINNNNSLKGLVYYGDVNQAVGIGVVENQIELWQVKDNQRSVLNKTTLENTTPVLLKMVVSSGFQTGFYWKQSPGNWNEISTGNAYYDASFLPPWDRSPRPGLHVLGSPDKPALFDYCKISYQ